VLESRSTYASTPGALPISRRKKRGEQLQFRARSLLRRRRDAVLEIDDRRMCDGCERLLDAVEPVGRNVGPIKMTRVMSPFSETLGT